MINPYRETVNKGKRLEKVGKRLETLWGKRVNSFQVKANSYGLVKSPPISLSPFPSRAFGTSETIVPVNFHAIIELRVKPSITKNGSVHKRKPFDGTVVWLHPKEWKKVIHIKKYGSPLTILSIISFAD